MTTLMAVVALIALDGGALWALLSAQIGGAFGIAALMLLVHNLAAAAIVRALDALAPVREGTFRAGSPGFDRWQARATVACLSCNLFDRILPIFVRAQWYMLFGARLRMTSFVGGRILDGPLVEMEPQTLLGDDGVITGHLRTGDSVTIGRVLIRRGATVGMRAIVCPGVTVGEGAVVGAGALVASGRSIPPGETWVGIPARAIRRDGACAPAGTLDAEHMVFLQRSTPNVRRSTSK
jgi:carbonic anhydrase/acetyltransferase-like protein (isoleucine patch superfamily)